MSHLAIQKTSTPAYPFFLHEIRLTTTLSIHRPENYVTIELTNENLLINHTLLFQRPVVYLDPSHRAKLHETILQIQGFSEYLQGCLLLFKQKDLFPFITDTMKIKNHKNDLPQAIDLLMKSAHYHFPGSQYLMGFFFLYGLKISKEKEILPNQTHALKYLIAASQQNHTLSINLSQLVQKCGQSQKYQSRTSPQTTAHQAPQPQYTYIDIINNLTINNRNLLEDINQLQQHIFMLTHRIQQLESMIASTHQEYAKPPASLAYDLNTPEPLREENEAKRQKMTSLFND